MKSVIVAVNFAILGVFFACAPSAPPSNASAASSSASQSTSASGATSAPVSAKPSASSANSAKPSASPATVSSFAGPADGVLTQLVSYDPASHGVAPETIQVDFGGATVPNFRVKTKQGSSTSAWYPLGGGWQMGDAYPAHVPVQAIAGTTSDWAAGMQFAWIIVGSNPSPCGANGQTHGFLIVEDSHGALVGEGTYFGGCGTDSHVAKFATAGGQKIILEDDTDTGDEPTTHKISVIWRLDETKHTFSSAGGINLTAEQHADRMEHKPKFVGTMTATLEFTDKAIRANETWTFTPTGAGKSHTKTRQVLYTWNGKEFLAPKNLTDLAP